MIQVQFQILENLHASFKMARDPSEMKLHFFKVSFEIFQREVACTSLWRSWQVSILLHQFVQHNQGGHRIAYDLNCKRKISCWSSIQAYWMTSLLTWWLWTPDHFDGWNQMQTKYCLYWYICIYLSQWWAIRFLFHFWDSIFAIPFFLPSITIGK